MMRCKKCGLCETRINVVPGRGIFPAEVLFIGEAPGKSEDVLGEAFVGKSGKLLDAMLKEAGLKEAKYFITNTVLCRPTNELGGVNREPTPTEVASCGANIFKIIEKVNPKVVVFVGKVAERFYGDEFTDGFSIQHPSFLLRTGGLKSPWYKQNVRILENVFNVLKGEAVNENY